MSTKTIRVVGAAIIKDGEVLCAQRAAEKSLAGYWEFPGGKIEPGESEIEALEREIKEELRCSIVVGEKISTAVYHYDFATVELSVFLARITSGEPVNTEHARLEWVKANTISNLEWAPADLDAVSRLAHTVLA